MLTLTSIIEQGSLYYHNQYTEQNRFYNDCMSVIKHNINTIKQRDISKLITFMCPIIKMDRHRSDSLAFTIPHDVSLVLKELTKHFTLFKSDVALIFKSIERIKQFGLPQNIEFEWIKNLEKNGYVFNKEEKDFIVKNGFITSYDDYEFDFSQNDFDKLFENYWSVLIMLKNQKNFINFVESKKFVVSFENFKNILKFTGFYIKTERFARYTGKNYSYKEININDCPTYLDIFNFFLKLKYSFGPNDVAYVFSHLVCISVHDQLVMFPIHDYTINCVDPILDFFISKNINANIEHYIKYLIQPFSNGFQTILTYLILKKFLNLNTYNEKTSVILLLINLNDKLYTQLFFDNCFKYTHSIIKIIIMHNITNHIKTLIDSDLIVNCDMSIILKYACIHKNIPLITHCLNNKQIPDGQTDLWLSFLGNHGVKYNSKQITQYPLEHHVSQIFDIIKLFDSYGYNLSTPRLFFYLFLLSKDNNKLTKQIEKKTPLNILSNLKSLLNVYQTPICSNTSSNTYSKEIKVFDSYVSIINAIEKNTYPTKFECDDSFLLNDIKKSEIMSDLFGYVPNILAISKCNICFLRIMALERYHNINPLSDNNLILSENQFDLNKENKPEKIEKYTDSITDDEILKKKIKSKKI